MSCSAKVGLLLTGRCTKVLSGSLQTWARRFLSRPGRLGGEGMKSGQLDLLLESFQESQESQERESKEQDLERSCNLQKITRTSPRSPSPAARTESLPPPLAQLEPRLSSISSHLMNVDSSSITADHLSVVSSSVVSWMQDGWTLILQRCKMTPTTTTLLWVSGGVCTAQQPSRCPARWIG